MASSDVGSKAVALLLFIRCLFVAPIGFVDVLCLALIFYAVLSAL